MRLLVRAAAVAAALCPAHGWCLIHHDLKARVEPDSGHLAVHDRLSFSKNPRNTGVEFLLHGGLVVEAPGDADIRCEPLARVSSPPLQLCRARISADQPHLSLSYSGAVSHPLRSTAPAREGGTQVTEGLVGPTGVFLDGASYWYPRFDKSLLTFSLKTTLPDRWTAVSQGSAFADADGSVNWQETHPQDDIYLIAAPFEVYREETNWGEALVFLRTPAPDLATTYLEATKRYIDLYSRLLGPYPYRKFALVENFWESGYGMPSFTLLGPRVIRLPFIPYTSYPHEILHNWFGNGVYVDYGRGNWSEGLTSYLADHLLAEERGKGSEYRRSALQKYADYVARDHDFPLSAFRARHDDVTQAVGYGKGLMFFHMLRRRLGDGAFTAGLRSFVRDNMFDTAGYDELQKAFQAQSGRSLQDFFDQWLSRVGSPALTLSDVTVSPRGDGFRVSGVLHQTQAEPAFRLDVPVAIRTQSPSETLCFRVATTTKRQNFDFDVATPPLSLSVDPDFDLFRRLDNGELPPSLGQLFAAPDVLFVLPSEAEPKTREHYRDIATRWGATADRLVTDADIVQLPTDTALWLFGWQNRFLDRFTERLGPLLRRDGGRALIEDQGWPRTDYGVVATAHAKGDTGATWGWLAADNPNLAESLIRKLPHYGKYSYLVFAAEDQRNILKGQWPLLTSPLALQLAKGSAESSAPLTCAPSEESLVRLLGHTRSMESGTTESLSD